MIFHIGIKVDQMNWMLHHYIGLQWLKHGIAIVVRIECSQPWLNRSSNASFNRIYQVSQMYEAETSRSVKPYIWFTLHTQYCASHSCSVLFCSVLLCCWVEFGWRLWGSSAVPPTGTYYCDCLKETCILLFHTDNTVHERETHTAYIHWLTDCALYTVYVLRYKTAYNIQVNSMWFLYWNKAWWKWFWLYHSLQQCVGDWIK